MTLSNNLVRQFAKAVNSDTKQKSDSSLVMGTVTKSGGKTYVRIDGSDINTPVASTTDVLDGERVAVTIKNHEAFITGNFTAPSARSEDVKELANLVSDKASIRELTAVKGDIQNLHARTVDIDDRLTAQSADIENLNTEKLSVKKKLEAAEADINTINGDVANFKETTTDRFKANEAEIGSISGDFASFKATTTDRFKANEADIKTLDTEKLAAKDANLKYANVDFSNIGKTAMQYFYAQSGLIKDVQIGDATISGELVGVTIKGDLIEGNTIVADKLVIKGTDGLYYKLNTDGVTTEKEQTDYNSINGQVIRAKSITATKIDVSDLVAFGATIGGFKIGQNTIYSGVKESVDNTTRGIYMDTDGQFVIGDSNQYFKYYKDTDGKYKIDVSAASMRFGVSNKTVEEALDEVRDEIATLLRIETSRGTVFKNDQVSTVLSVVLYHGKQRITDSETMKKVFGSGAYLQWKWQRLDDDSFGVLSNSDSRFGDDGFTFTLSPEDVDTKVTFMCELII